MKGLKWGGMRERIRFFAILGAVLGLIVGLSMPANATSYGQGSSTGPVQRDGGSVTNLTSAAAVVTSIPAAQRHTGQAPPGYATGHGPYYNAYILKDGAEINADVNTYLAECIYVGVNTLLDQSTHDGIGRWVCEQPRNFDCPPGTPACIPLPATKTQFYTDQHDWYVGITRFADVSNMRAYKWAINSVTHNVTADFFQLHV